MFTVCDILHVTDNVSIQARVVRAEVDGWMTGVTLREEIEELGEGRPKEWGVRWKKRELPEWPNDHFPKRFERTPGVPYRRRLPRVCRGLKAYACR